MPLLDIQLDNLRKLRIFSNNSIKFFDACKADFCGVVVAKPLGSLSIPFHFIGVFWRC